MAFAYGFGIVMLVVIPMILLAYLGMAVEDWKKRRTPNHKK